MYMYGYRLQSLWRIFPVYEDKVQEYHADITDPVSVQPTDVM